MRIGIYGGTFDPVHFGHLLLAESCREQLNLDQVWFFPAAISPLKQSTPPASGKQRAEMLELAIGGHEGFVLRRDELNRGGVSYTVDTLAELKEQQPDDQLFFLVGSDSLSSFPDWVQPGRICEIAQLVVVNRGQEVLDLQPLVETLTPNQMTEVEAHRVQMPGIDISSSDLRERVVAGKSIRYQLPRAVEMYIKTHRLYTAPE